MASNAAPGTVQLSHILARTLSPPHPTTGSHLKTQSKLRTGNWKHSPKDEDEEHQQHAEGGHIVHGLHEDDELALQCWHEADQLQHPHETKGAQDREPPALLAHNLPHAEEDKKMSMQIDRQSLIVKAQWRGREGKVKFRERGQRCDANARSDLDSFQACKEQSPT